MKCYNCDREITDEFSICPYCHMKQRKNSTAKYIPANNQATSEKDIISTKSTEAFQNNLPPTDITSNTNRIQSRPDNVNGHTNPVRETKKGCNNGCKYSITVITVFFGIGIIITAIVGMMGMSANNYSSDNSVPPDYTLSTVPTLPILTTTVQQTWNPVVTVARTSISSQINSGSSVSSSRQDLVDEASLRLWFMNFAVMVLEYGHRDDLPMERNDYSAVIQNARDKRAYHAQARSELKAISVQSTLNQEFKGALLKLIDEHDLCATYLEKTSEAALTKDTDTMIYYRDKWTDQIRRVTQQTEIIGQWGKD